MREGGREDGREEGREGIEGGRRVERGRGGVRDGEGRSNEGAVWQRR